jgi:hypothetical protein
VECFQYPGLEIVLPVKSHPQVRMGIVVPDEEPLINSAFCQHLFGEGSHDGRK